MDEGLQKISLVSQTFRKVMYTQQLLNRTTFEYQLSIFFIFY